MTTYITRMWLNNCNNFIISDCMDKHAAAVVEMLGRGGIKLATDVCAHELGVVLVLRGDQAEESKS